MTTTEGIDHISPSLAEALMACPYRAIRSVSGASPKGPPTLPAALGNAAHRLSKRAHDGEFDDVREDDLLRALVSAWDQEIRTEYSTLVAQHPGTPPPRRWRGHNLARTRLTRGLARLVVARHDGSAPDVLATEEWLEDSQLGLIGQVDRVERDSGILRIVDLKSGWVAGRDPMPPSYERQLSIYAYLWAKRTGEWPAEIGVQSLDGSLTTSPVDRSRVNKLVDKVIRARSSLNQHLAHSRDPAAAAKPGADACRYCPQRPTCEPFWASANSSWDWWLVSVRGKVVDIERYGDSHAISVEPTATTAAPNTETIRILGISLETDIQAGVGVAIVDAHPTSVPTQLRLTWTSQIQISED